MYLDFCNTLTHANSQAVFLPFPKQPGDKAKMYYAITVCAKIFPFLVLPLFEGIACTCMYVHTCAKSSIVCQHSTST